jgi:hypothetical protein
LESILTLTVSGAGEYGYFDFQTINVTVNVVREYRFRWSIPDIAGAYVVEVGLVGYLSHLLAKVWIFLIIKKKGMVWFIGFLVYWFDMVKLSP